MLQIEHFKWIIYSIKKVILPSSNVSKVSSFNILQLVQRSFKKDFLDEIFYFPFLVY